MGNSHHKHSVLHRDFAFSPFLIPISMASPPEAVVNAIGLTELNPELSPDETLGEFVSQPCND